jgi:hypothetical protein
MARRPARLERAGALTPRDRIWAAIRALSAGCWGAAAPSFSPAELVALSCQRLDTVLSYLRCLEKGGHVAVVDGRRPQHKPRRECILFRLQRDSGVDAPRVNPDGSAATEGIGYLQMWNAARWFKGDFDKLELAHHASTPAHKVSVAAAKSFLLHLKRAGYVAEAGAVASNRPSRYRFVRSRDSGPRPPVISEDKSVMDGNTGDVMWPKADA